MLMPRSDSELIARFLSGEKTAFDDLLKRYQSPIRQFLRRLTAGDHALADDIAQDAFIKMFTGLATFRGDAGVSTWMHTIAYRCFLRHLQSSSRLDLVDDAELAEDVAVHCNVVNDIMVEQLMKHLSINERLMVTLSFSAGMSHSEIAQVTGAPLGTIKSHVNRGRKKLARLLNVEEPAT